MDHHYRQAAKAVIAHISAHHRELAPSFQEFIKNVCQHESRDLIARAVLDFARHHHLPGAPEAKRRVMRIGETLPSQKVRARIVDALMKKADGDPEAALEILNVPGRTGMGEDADMSALASYLHHLDTKRNGKSVGDSPLDFEGHSPSFDGTFAPHFMGDSPCNFMGDSPLISSDEAASKNPQFPAARNTADQGMSEGEKTHGPLVSPPLASVSDPILTASSPQESQRPATPAIRAEDAPSASKTLPASPARKHRKRASDMTAEEIAHVRLAMLASQARSKPLNIEIMVRLEKTSAYRKFWNPSPDSKGKIRSPNSEGERQARAQARRASANALSRLLEALGRDTGAPVPYIAVYELPAKGGSGLHVHIKAHLPDREAVQILIRRLSKFTNTTPEMVQNFQRLADSNHLPFDVRGEESFVRNPDARFASEKRSWQSAAYLCKSAAQDIEATIAGRSTSLGAIRPEVDERKHLRHMQDIRAYQQQNADISITKRVRFSRCLGWAALAVDGFTPDKAGDAGWLLKSERNRRDGIHRRALPAYSSRAPSFLPREPENSPKSAISAIITLEREEHL
ncbi:MAG: hypothetical protein ABF932_04680 [Gluconobacter potus]|uniref:Uncharacterized protein n=3 Tax=Acetobacteraceae TaxID=433 RepID=A0ABR9YK39_9PROT|nr:MULTISPECIES: hypothetical protein [Gluconobacter]MBF0863470.1 hypothetical protein [Gluconobacter sp. R71656]MBF0866277.1 hypothetical protein [Gluconobacter sp. R75628]MBF0872595.1 hypothetical protein [Gluconobacter sp. R75629]MBF0881561.1 hypothetical protein [Gluconobacter potus]